MNQSKHHRVDDSRQHRLRSSAALFLAASLLWAGNCDAGGNAGTLHYTGMVSGSITFPSAQCTALNGKLMSFTAPVQPTSGSTPPGPVLTYTAMIQSLEFMVDGVNGNATNSFMRGHSNAGITWQQVHGSWELHLDHVKIYNMDVTNQKPVILDGTFTCTNPSAMNL